MLPLVPPLARILALVLILCGTTPAVCADGPVYYLAVGSSNYVLPPEGSGLRGLPRLRGANTGARAVAERLTRGGAAFGIILTSAEGRYVRAVDVTSALDDVVARAKRESPAGFTMILYLAGHGITEGVAWNHFSLPGDFVYRGDPSQFDVETLTKSSLHAAALVDRLGQVGVPYLLVLDTCYEGEEARFASPVLTGTAVESLRGVASVLRHMNEFRQEEPVLFSTAPGTVVLTVPDPSNPGGDSVGPLARRAMIVIDTAQASGGTVTVADLVRGMTDPGLDGKTRPAVTSAQPAGWWARTLYAAPATKGRSEARFGTGSGMGEPCCAPAAPETRTETPMAGRVQIVGERGEYVTAGRRLDLGPGTRWVAEGTDTGSIVLRGETRSGTTWEIALSAPEGRRLTPGRFDHAERHGFAAATAPGLSVTGDGRGCNVSSGQFTVEDIAFAPNGTVARLRARLRQFCDGSTSALDGMVDLNAWGR